MDKQLAKQEQASKLFTCEVTIKGDDGEPVAKPIFPQKDRCKEDANLMQQDQDDYDAIVKQTEEEEIASNFTPAQKQAVYTRLHIHMDKQLAKHSAKFKQWLQERSVDAYCAMFSKCMEQATLDFAQHQGKRTPYQGRGKINIQKVEEAPRATYNVNMQAMIAPLTREGARLLLQTRRATSVRDNLQSLQKIIDGKADNSKESALRYHLKGTIAKLKGDWAIHDDFRQVYDLLDPSNLCAKPIFLCSPESSTVG